MARLAQICVVFIAIQWCEVAPKPIFESINIERKVNIGFKPFKLRPISFIKEKWGPFGRFGKKHTIEKRDIEEMNTIDTRLNDLKPLIVDRMIPVIEKSEEPVKVGPFLPYRPPTPAVTEEKEAPPASKLNTDISPAIPPNPYFTPAKKPELQVLGPVVETAPIEGPLIVPVTPVVEASVPPPPPPAPVEEPPSRLGAFARFFGDIIADIFSRIIARARTTFFPNQPAAQ